MFGERARSTPVCGLRHDKRDTVERARHQAFDLRLLRVRVLVTLLLCLAPHIAPQHVVGAMCLHAGGALPCVCTDATHTRTVVALTGVADPRGRFAGVTRVLLRLCTGLRLHPVCHQCDGVHLLRVLRWRRTAGRPLRRPAILWLPAHSDTVGKCDSFAIPVPIAVPSADVDLCVEL